MTETASPPPPLSFLDRPQGERLAYRHRAGDPGKPGIVWFGGFRSDMDGTKATALDQWAARNRRTLLRFDYFAHGHSSGNFEAATIGLWRDDALAAFDALTSGPQILIGSSMGAWMTLLVTDERQARIAGLVLLAPAPDFTEALMWPSLTAETKRALQQGGVVAMDAPEGMEPYSLSHRFFIEARDHLVLEAGVTFSGPVRILQGMADTDVPWEHAVKTAQAIRSSDVTLTLIKAGDHRLSEPADIARLLAELEAL